MDSELLIRTSLSVLGILPGELVVVELCCGAGDLSCAVAAAHDRARVYAVDLGEDSIVATRRNVAQRGLEGRVTVHQGELFQALTSLDLSGRVAAVLCADTFDGAEYGIPIQRRVAAEAASFLRPGGALMFQIALGQERGVTGVPSESGAYCDVAFANDEAMRPRVAYAKRKRSPG